MKKTVSLAPMAGFTDYVFREICVLCGADFVTTEMVSAKGLVYGSEKTNELLAGCDRGNCSIQLFGHEPEIMKKAIEIILEKHAPYSIDINMGCPMKKIVNNGDGSALMRNIPLSAEVASACVKAAGKYNIPVSAKIRAGWNDSEKNAPELSKALEESGVSFITVHGRTRAQMYEGKSDPDIIKTVREKVSIPVIANGDVTDAESAEKLIEHTGCDGVSVGRAALGNPFIFSEISSLFSGQKSPERPSTETIIKTALYHLKKEIEFYGEEKAVRATRAQLIRYTKGMRGGAKIRNDISRISSYKEAEEIFLSIMGGENA